MCFTFFYVSAICYALVVGENGLNISGPSIKQFRGPIVVPNGKEYHAENTTLKTWEQAKQACHRKGLELATITEQDDFNALQTAIDSVELSGRFWTDGIDAGIWRQFTWDNTGKEVTGFDTWILEEPTHELFTCLCVRVKENKLVYCSAPCTEEAGLLCEKIA